MKGLWLENGDIQLRTDLDTPVAGPNEALIKVFYSGICSTDTGLISGLYDFCGIPGHEFVGIVESGPRDLIGKRVAGEINIACGECHSCRTVGKKHCSQRKVLGIREHPGAFAEYVTLPVENLHVVPQMISSDVATFIEPLAAAFDIIEKVDITPELHTVIIGDGKLGQLIARVIKTKTDNFVVLGRYPEKLSRLPSDIDSTHQSDELDPQYFDIVIECTGNASGFDTALKLIKPGGKLILKSTYSTPLSLDATVLVVNEIQVIGSRCGPFERAIEYLQDESNAADIATLIDREFTLTDGVAAFEHLKHTRTQNKHCLKLVLDITG
ncbi:MAG: alcohol dehydrogenase catalytic domain-containing protein [Pseudomonadales bacterium]|nr:alcohol dehydrogenase catalytic domain-containing protein [Pseudomonadales bacterium]